MNEYDLITQPVCEGRDLGRPMPDTTHAVSMALPRWEDVVGYEEHRPEVQEKLRTGYPRFVIHPLVKQLAEHIAPGMQCLPFPSFRTAEACAAFVLKSSGAQARIVSHDGIFGVITDTAGAPASKAFWQHAGMIVSSRQAEAHLAGRSATAEHTEVRRELRQRLAELYECAEDDVFLTPTGMAAHYTALQAVMTRSPGCPTAQLGFPYVDTLKLQQKIGHGSHLLHKLDGIAKDVHELLHRERLAACFCEIPGNPLLGSADIRSVSPILRDHGVPLVVDDVVATPYNINLRPYADLIPTSLTKFIVGSCDAMGGALICNPSSPFYAELKAIVKAQHEDLLWGEDAHLLNRQAKGFTERMQRHNENGLLIAERLRKHPAVDRVWYPKWEFTDVYESVRRPNGGWGALITFLPKQAEQRSPKVFDALRVCKGPSLGTIFTLACPFTLIAHYCELDWAESCGVSRHLIRLSIGLENPEELWHRIEEALNTP